MKPIVANVSGDNVSCVQSNGSFLIISNIDSYTWFAEFNRVLLENESRTTCTAFQPAKIFFCYYSKHISWL